MTDSVEISDVVGDVQQGSAAVLRLAQDAGLFAEAVKAFRSHDGEAWQGLLNKAQLLGTCHHICDWVCSKECVRLCILLAGPPREPVTVDQIAPFSAVLQRLAQQPELIKALAMAVEAEDTKAFRAVVDRLQAGAFIHLLCHWACFIRCHLICRVLCERARWNPEEFITRLRESAVAVASVATKPEQLKQLIAGAATLNCAVLKGIFGEFQDCRLICFWLCSWRCLVICLSVTRSFKLTGDFSVEEMRAFAQFSGEIARDPAQLRLLVAAVMKQDEQAFIGWVRQHKADRFVHQLCHWVCYLVCQRLCICVCPPPGVVPLFDHVGIYRVDPFYGDFTATGTTTAGDLAFTAGIPLLGLLPDSPVGDPVEYRFTAENLAGGGANPLTVNEIGGTTIGALEFWEWDPAALPAPGQWVLRTFDYKIGNAVLTHDIQQQVGPPLTVQVSTPITADGWVRVPSDNNLTHGGGGKFVFGGTLAALDTTKLTFETFDLIGPGAGLPVIAGTPIPAGTLPAGRHSTKPVFRIVFEARKVMGAVSLHTNTLPKIALSNTQFTYNRHPDWAGSPPLPSTVSPLVLSLDIAELIGHGCDPLSAAGGLHALYTVYHPYLGSCRLFVEGPAPVPAETHPAIDADGQALSPGGVPAGEVIDSSHLAPCAYILWLKATLRLTVGNGPIGGEPDDHMAFCIH